jgi:invasion protein IalB
MTCRKRVLASCGALPLVLAAILSAHAQAQQAPSSGAAPAQLPGGAQAVNETFQDWQMSCVQAQGGKRCAVSQQQLDEKTRQRVLVFELQPRGDKAEGVLVLPFGLALDKGVTVKAGEAELGPALRFKTCLPQGCVVPLNLDAKAMALLRKASALTVGVVSDAGQPANLSVSLKGFSSAFERATALAR